MSYIDFSKNYQRLFHFEGVDFLMNDIWMAFYKSLDALETAIEDNWYCWLPKKILEEQLADGTKFFADNQKFEDYYQAHVAYLDKLLAIFDSDIKQRETITRQNVENFLEHCRLSLS